MAKRKKRDQGLPLLGDPRLQIELSREGDAEPQLRLYFDGEHVGPITLNEAEYVFLSELILAAKRAEGRRPEAAFVPGKHLAVRFKAYTNFEPNRRFHTISELRDKLTKPLFERRLLKDDVMRRKAKGKKKKGSLPLRERLVEHKPLLGYRIGLPAANLATDYVRRDPPQEPSPHLWN